MIAEHEIALALAGDATRIAMMSRDLIEQGLAWRWTPPRILRMIRDPVTNVAVARGSTGIAGFALMQYKDDEAHLLLLGVDPAQRRRGVGRSLMKWLEATALDAGIGLVYLEARARNMEGRAFYRELGYVEISTVQRLYSDQEHGVRIAKDLWLDV